MGIFEWYDKKAKQLRWTDIAFLKLGVAAFVLMIAKLWSPILSLDWYWYGLIFVLAYIKIMKKVFGK